VSTSHLILDIETVPDVEMPLPTTDGVPSAPFHRVVCIGCMLFDGYVPRRIGTKVGDERDILRTLVPYIHSGPVLVTFNGRGFDVPVICARALKYGIPMATWYGSRNTRYRYSPDAHLDLMDFMCDYGAGRYPSLDAMARLVGLPGKQGSGAQVQHMDLADVERYCLSDVAQTAGLFLRVQLLRGHIAPGDFERVADDFLVFLDMYRDISKGIDRERFKMVTT
jgi:predicted PolB exonuclease-like 3'-5' exonuclease